MGLYKFLQNLYLASHRHSQPAALMFGERLFLLVWLALSMPKSVIHAQIDGELMFEQGQYRAALDWAKGVLAQQPHQPNLESARIHTIMGNAYLQLGNQQQALESHRTALQLRLRLSGSHSLLVSNSYQNISTCWRDQIRPDSTLYYLYRVVSIRQQLPNINDDLASAYHSLAVAHLENAQSDSAEIYLTKALRLRRQLYPDTHLKLAPLYLDMGRVGALRRDTTSAYDALNCLEAILNASDNDTPEWRTRLHLAYGDSYRAGGRLDSCVVHYHKGLNYAKTLGEDSPLTIQAYKILGQFLQQIGDPVQGVGYLQKAAASLERIHENPLSLANVYNEISLCYRYTGQLDKLDTAIHYMERVLAIYDANGAINHPNKQGFYINLGQLHFSKKNYGTAATYFIQAAVGNNPQQQLWALLHHSQCSIERGALQEARSLLERASRQNRYSQHPHEWVDIRISYQLGKISATTPVDALRHYETALSLIAKSKHPDDYAVVQEALLIATATARLLLAQKDGNIPSALAALTACDSALTLQRQQSSQVAFAAARYGWLLHEKTSQLFDIGVAASIFLYQQLNDGTFAEKAFYYSELGKSAQLVNNMHLQSPPAHLLVPPPLLAEWRERQRRIYFLHQSNQRNHPTYTPTPNTSQELPAAIQGLKRLEAELSGQYPAFAEWIKAPTTTISLANLQAMLAADQTLIEYMLAQNRLFIFVVNKTELHINEAAIPNGLKDDIIEFYTLASTPPSEYSNQSEHARRLVRHGKDLYGILLRPIAHWLRPACILVPHNILAYIPFAALIKQSRGEPHLYKNHDYFGRSHRISYTYSATTLGLITAGEHRTTPNKLLKLAPDFVHHPLHLSHLTYNQPEALALHKRYAGDCLLSDQATVSAFLSAISTHRFVHLATHGSSGAETAGQGFIAFAPCSRYPTGVLRIHEIYSVHIPLEMLVLSACQTGTGHYAELEGILSLARAFSHAGCESVVASMWVVDDKTTNGLMSEFYEGLYNGIDKATAWQLTLNKHFTTSNHETAHPFYWAALHITGTTRPITLVRTIRSWKWTLPTVLVLAMLVLAMTRQPKRAPLP